MLPGWRSSPAWAKVARVVLGTALVVLFVLFVNEIRTDF